MNWMPWRKAARIAGKRIVLRHFAFVLCAKIVLASKGGVVAEG